MGRARVTAPGQLFSEQLETLRAYADTDKKASLREEQTWWAWYAPEKQGWSGDPFDLEGLSEAFSREQHHQEFDQAVSDSSNPGTVGDLAASSLQGDLLAQLERAYRSRLRTSVRNKINAAARRGGHGDEEAGVVALAFKDYVSSFIKGGSSAV